MRHRRSTSTQGFVSGGFRVPLTVFAACALGFAATALVVRVQPVRSILRLVLAVGATFVPLAAFVGLLIALLCRRLLLSLLGVFLLTATLAIQVSWYYLGHPPKVAEFTELRVLSSNLRLGEADAESFVNTANLHADVITAAELTPEAIVRFKMAGLEETFPYSVLVPAPGPGGMGIWSRYPVKALTVPKHRGILIPAARVELPSLEYKPLIASVHVHSPVASNSNRVNEWRMGMAAAKAQLDNFAKAAGPGSVIVGGDYNSTPDIRQFRDLLTNGYRDAVEQLGAGFGPTFPANKPIPPVITIDHILIRNAAAASINTITIKGSDHRALLATIRVPLNPAA